MSTRGTGSKEIDEMLESLPSSTRSLAMAVREFVLSTLSQAVEIPDPKARVIGYGYGTGYKDMVATIILSKSGVKLGLVQGASLPDPNGLLEGKGKVHRYVSFSEPDHVGRVAVKSLLLASLAAWRERSSGAT